MVFNTGAALLDSVVLAVVSREREGTYGYKITQDVRKALDISESTLYPVLRRLQKDECLEIPKEGYLTITSHLLDDVAMVLGLRDKVIKGTEEDADGGAYPDDVEKRMLDAYNYVKDNLFYIESLLHQMCMEGVKVGKYKAHDRDLIWEKEDD